MSARPRDLAGMRGGLQQLPSLRAYVSMCNADAPLLKTIHDALATPADCLDLVERAIAMEPAAMVRDGGVIARGYDAELDELRGLSENAGQFLVDLETRERARTASAICGLSTTRCMAFISKSRMARPIKCRTIITAARP